MITVFHKFPAGTKAFGIVQPPSQLTLSEKLVDIKVIDPGNPGIFCFAHVVEVLQFSITGKINYFPDWMSLVLFDLDADPLLAHILKRYPEAEKQNQFEIWIVRKLRTKS